VALKLKFHWLHSNSTPDSITHEKVPHTPKVIRVAKVASSNCVTAFTTRSYQLTGAILQQCLTAVTINKRNLLCWRIQHSPQTVAPLFSFGRPHCQKLLSKSCNHTVQFHKLFTSPKNT